jgi:hypothetical protein
VVSQERDERPVVSEILGAHGVTQPSCSGQPTCPLSVLQEFAPCVRNFSGMRVGDRKIPRDSWTETGERLIRRTQPTDCFFVSPDTNERHAKRPPVTPPPCANLATLPASGFPVPDTVITSAVDVPPNPQLATPERCVVQGYVNRHISPVDQCSYEDYFQVQLPANWNGRLWFEGGGQEGVVLAAIGITNAGAFFGRHNGYAVGRPRREQPGGFG